MCNGLTFNSSEPIKKKVDLAINKVTPVQNPAPSIKSENLKEEEKIVPPVIAKEKPVYTSTGKK